MLRRVRGQASSETMLVVSVIVLAAVASSATLIPLFSDGVQDLGSDAKAILSTGSVGGVGRGGDDGANAAAPGTSPYAGPDDRSTASGRMNPDSQRVGDATGTQSPRNQGPDLPTTDADRRRSPDRRDTIRMDNIGPPLDQLA